MSKSSFSMTLHILPSCGLRCKVMSFNLCLMEKDDLVKPAPSPPEPKGDPLEPFRKEAASILKSSMERRRVSAKQLAALLDESDPKDGQGRAFANKLNKGAFGFAWAIRALRTLGVTELDLRPVSGPERPQRDDAQIQSADNNAEKRPMSG